MTSPRFSIVTPVHDPPLPLLDACIRSVIGQTVPDWEWCLADDGSAHPGVVRRLDELALDPRVRLVRRPTSGGIVAASNDALALATGEHVALLDHDDRLAPVALNAVAAAIDADPTIDYVYTDEDKLGADGEHFDELLKPDWSPERLRAQNYCTHLSVLRTSLVRELGGFRDGLDGRQDHDLILRVAERARTVHHVPEVLYHWCVAPGSAAGDQHAKPQAAALGVRIVTEHIDRLGIAGTVEPGPHPGTFRVHRHVDRPPPVSVVIPTAGTARPVWGVDRPLIERCLDSLLAVTEHPAMEVIIVADPETPPDVLATIAGTGVTVVHGEGPFNFSQRINLGATHASGEQLLLLNDDVLVEQPDWLSVMAGFLAEHDVGAVGCRLLYADGTLQHGGILCNEQPLHIFHGYAGDEPGPFGLLRIDREVSAVTAACLLTPRSVFDEVGGLPEHFAVAFNDLDYCLRVRATGRRIIWTPRATLHHFESQSRGGDVAAAEIDELYARWGHELRHDPYGNPNFAPRQAEWLSRAEGSTSYGLRSGLRSMAGRLGGLRRVVSPGRRSRR